MQITKSVNAASRQWRKQRNSDEEDADERSGSRSRRPASSPPRRGRRASGCAGGEPAADVLVPGCDPADLQDDLRQQEADRDRQPDEQRIAAEGRDEEDADRVLGADRSWRSAPQGRRQPARAAVRPTVAPQYVESGLRQRQPISVAHPELSRITISGSSASMPFTQRQRRVNLCQHAVPDPPPRRIGRRGRGLRCRTSVSDGRGCAAAGDRSRR